MAPVEIDMKRQSKKCADISAKKFKAGYLSGGVRRMDDSRPVGVITRKYTPAKVRSQRKDRVETGEDIPC